MHGGQTEGLKRSYRLLVADDDDGFRRTVCDVFRPFLDVVEAVDGDDAVARASQEPLDLALCDLHMPGRNGLEVLSEFQRLHTGHPGILMSANLSSAVRTQAQRQAVYHVLEKPFTRRELLTTMADAIRAVFHDPGLSLQFPR